MYVLSENIKKKSKFFQSNFQFLLLKISLNIDRQVFVMDMNTYIIQNIKSKNDHILYETKE